MLASRELSAQIQRGMFEASKLQVSVSKAASQRKVEQSGVERGWDRRD